LSESDNCEGLGLFNVYPIKKSDFIIEYLGEIIVDENELNLRDSWAKNS